MDACSLAGSVDTSHRNTGDKFAVDSHIGTTKLGDGKGKSFFYFFFHLLIGVMLNSFLKGYLIHNDRQS